MPCHAMPEPPIHPSTHKKTNPTQTQPNPFKPRSTPPGTCAVLVRDGERSLVANLGAANKFTADHLVRV